MGTKRALAPYVARAVDQCPDGPFLDAFAGMCSVAQEVALHRPKWTNDLQVFATNAAVAYLGPTTDVPLDFRDRIETASRIHYSILVEHYRAEIDRERCLLACTDSQKFLRQWKELQDALSRKQTRNYDLFASTYAHTYVGIEQAIEIDSLRFAIDQHCKVESSRELRARMMLLAGLALLRASATTGHFAQFQSPNTGNWKRLQRTRRISVLDKFFELLPEAFSLGSEMGGQLRAFNSDALVLLRALSKCEEVPAVVYADPPYKQDQYSRYYHLLETLVLYDYPRTTAKARYREKRAVSAFSSKAKAARSISALASLSSKAGSALILSYPGNGISGLSPQEIIEIMKTTYPMVELIHQSQLSHSTMGASKGSATQAAEEYIYFGRDK